jgi:hypothetical protein
MHIVKEAAMFENNFNQNLLARTKLQAENIHSFQYNTAINYFRSAIFDGWISRIRRRILGYQQWLYDLASLKPQIALQGGSYSGIKVVGINNIIGTEGRAANFDIDFYPVSEESRERWVNMAVAYLARTPLPPVELIQVGDKYFVRDGHHRISVARAFGQTAVDAEVITWQARPPFPWQENLQLQPAHIDQNAPAIISAQ